MSATRLLMFALILGAQAVRAASDIVGQIAVVGVPVPGATVTATQGELRVFTISDEQGVFRLAGLPDGAWTVRVEMGGFSPTTREITLPDDAEPATWELTLLPFAEIARRLPPRVSQPVAQATPGSRLALPEGSNPASSPRSTGDRAQDGRDPTAGAVRGAGDSTQPGGQAPGTGGFQRAAVSSSLAPAPATGNPFAGDAADDAGGGTADGFLINGSVNNGAASPFAQARAFGNARPGLRSLYSGGLALLANTSAWDSRPYSFTSRQMPKPDYHDIQFNGTFGGPLRIPRIIRTGGNFFVGVQRTSDHTATTQPALVPTMLERGGDFSQSHDASGRPVEPVDPSTGQPFADRIVPRDRISPEAASLLDYYPPPNSAGPGGYNYQRPIVVGSRQDSVQARVTQNLNNRDQLVGTVAYNRGTTDVTSLFGFTDSTRPSTLDTGAHWSHRLSPFLFLRTRYQLTRITSRVTPYFAHRINVSGRAGITGNNQDPLNWGPPLLAFSSGLEGLSSPQYADNAHVTHGWTGELFWNRGRHSVTMGGARGRIGYDVFSQQNARGSFGFTGATTGSDLADFLLGLPQTSAIAFGNADKRLRQSISEAWLNDDWRVSASLTLNLGVRWEYESPMTEAQGRLVNLDIASGFAAVSPVLGSQPTGTLTSRDFPSSLVEPDKRGAQPRLGVAWRPIPASSLVIRGGYGLYRNTNVYQPIALLMAQQPPLSTTSSVQTSPARPLTLANGFVSTGPAPLNTFAADPDFRVGYAENWQVSAQRDLPASLTITGTYLGSRGRRLMQAYLPNTYPNGAANPCVSCPSGFAYLTSAGSSLRNAGQVQLRRRLRNGFTATAQYTLAKATDDAAALGAGALVGSALAQNWLDLDADRGASSFDQRHQLTLLAQYTTGAGVAGGTLVDGVRGRLLKDWTFVTQLTTGSGQPLTPVYLEPVPGTGVTGTIRASLTAASPDAAPDGYYLNPAAYAAPAPGEWGTAGRNSGTGPAQFWLNGAVGRTFRWGNRLNLDWRFDATNLLNRVTYASVNTIVGSPQFGLPNRANQMRKLQSSLRLRF